MDVASKVRVHRSAHQLIPARAQTQVEFDVEDWDTGGDFDTGSYTFTAPEAGYYHVVAQLRGIQGTPQKWVVYVVRNAAVVLKALKAGSALLNSVSVGPVSGFVWLDAADTLKVDVWNGDTAPHNVSTAGLETWWCVTGPVPVA